MARMRGDDRQPDAMFSYVSAEQRVPADHPLRAIRALVDDVLRDIITREPSLSALRQEAKSQGHLDLAYDGMCKVADGVTTVDEITRVAETQK